MEPEEPLRWEGAQGVVWVKPLDWIPMVGSRVSPHRRYGGEHASLQGTVLSIAVSATSIVILTVQGSPLTAATFIFADLLFIVPHHRFLLRHLRTVQSDMR